MRVEGGELINVILRATKRRLEGWKTTGIPKREIAPFGAISI
jgi:hypothetical protein